MFYKIGNHIINLDKVTDIYVEDSQIKVAMENKTSYSIFIGDVDTNLTVNTIFKDICSLNGKTYHF